MTPTISFRPMNYFRFIIYKINGFGFIKISVKVGKWERVKVLGRDELRLVRV